MSFCPHHTSVYDCDVYLCDLTVGHPYKCSIFPLIEDIYWLFHMNAAPGKAIHAVVCAKILLMLSV